MGAIVIHGKRLFRQTVQRDGTEAVGLSAEDGGSDFPAYSTVQSAVNLCAEHNVPPEDWPIFYGIREADVDLEEIAARCERLRQHLANWDDECNHLWWLARVRGWLAHGEVFAVFE